MIFVAFLVPIGLYLLALGQINRRARPLVVSGPMDFAGVLFAASGFVVLGGPAALTALHERWRVWWVLGDPGAPREPLDLYRPYWALAAFGYFLAVVAVCAWQFMRARALTSIYNVETDSVREALYDACVALGLSPAVSGDLYVFGRPDGPECVTLELEPFDALKHVTLRWQPHDSPLRSAVEAELGRRLNAVGAPFHEGGLWLTTAGLFALVVALLILVVLTIRATLGGMP